MFHALIVPPGHEREIDDTLVVCWEPVLAGDRSAQARALLAATVAACTGVPASEQALLRRCGVCGGPHGSPVMDHPRLQVSWSTTTAVVVVAVTGSGPVGVDVESCAATWFEGFGQVVGTAHPGTPEQRARTWTTTEALLKARGTGLHTDPRAADPTGSQVYDVPVPVGLACTAVVLSPSRPRLELRGPPPGRRGPATAR